MEHADSSLGPDDLFVLEGLRSKGEAWIVGGWVRELISGGGETDLDLSLIHI